MEERTSVRWDEGWRLHDAATHEPLSPKFRSLAEFCDWVGRWTPEPRHRVAHRVALAASAMGQEDALTIPEWCLSSLPETHALMRRPRVLTVYRDRLPCVMVAWSDNETGDRLEFHVHGVRAFKTATGHNSHFAKLVAFPDCEPDVFVTKTQPLAVGSIDRLGKLAVTSRWRGRDARIVVGIELARNAAAHELENFANGLEPPVPHHELVAEAERFLTLRFSPIPVEFTVARGGMSPEGAAMRGWNASGFFSSQIVGQMPPESVLDTYRRVRSGLLGKSEAETYERFDDSFLRNMAWHIEESRCTLEQLPAEWRGEVHDRMLTLREHRSRRAALPYGNRPAETSLRA